MGRPGRKEELLEAAVALFSQKGFHATTVRDLADQVGMKSGSLYAHIATKEDLLEQIVLRSAEQFQAAVAPIVAGDAPAGVKLRQAMAAHIRVVASDPAAATVFLHEWKALSPERHATVIAARVAYEELLAAIIRQGVERGEFRPVDETFARLLVLSAVNWVYQWYQPGGPLGPDEVADRFAELILHGLEP